jgi:hypothetical protein
MAAQSAPTEPWPTHTDGSNKTVGEMTPTERARVKRESVDRLKSKFAAEEMGGIAKWEILNANNFRWGDETYATREAADAELRSFFKGVSGVDLKKFTIRLVPSAAAKGGAT